MGQLPSLSSTKNPHSTCLATALPAQEPSIAPHLTMGKRGKEGYGLTFFLAYQMLYQIPVGYNLASPSQALKGRYLWEAPRRQPH